MGAESLVCELGAEWIGDEHERMRALCRAFSIGLQRHRFDRPRLLRDGRLHGRATLEERFTPQGRAAWERLRKKYQGYSTAQQKWMDRFDWWT